MSLLRRLPAQRGPGTRLVQVWRDSAAGELAGLGLALAEQTSRGARLWRLERIRPAPLSPWWPGIPAPSLSLAAAQEGIDHALPADLRPAAELSARLRRLTTGEPALEAALLDGLAGLPGAATTRILRLRLSGPGPAVAALATELAGELALSAPLESLAGECLLAAGLDLPGWSGDWPELSRGMTPGEAFARIAGHLASAILRHAPGCIQGAAPEPVHQTRVAVRRLRSAIGLFAPDIDCPELGPLRAGLRGLGRVLGPARDWDVFLSGAGAAVASALPGDPDLVRLLAAARRRRLACYEELRAWLAGPEFRLLGMGLACFAAGRPWEHHAAPPDGPPDLEAYAARALDRRRRKLLAPGGDLSELSDADLHAVRLRAKRLRYAAECFAPLYPGRETRRWIRRLGKLQDRLGLLNDAAVAGALLAELPRGIGRGAGGGLVRGFLAARRDGARDGIGGIWRKLRKQDPFWA